MIMKSMLEVREHFLTNTRLRKIYSKDSKSLVETIKMYLKVYQDLLEHFILMLCRATFGIRLFPEE